MGWTVNTKGPTKGGLAAIAVIVSLFGGVILAAQGLVPGVPAAQAAGPTIITRCCFGPRATLVVIGDWKDKRAERQAALLDNALPAFHTRQAALLVAQGTRVHTMEVGIGPISTRRRIGTYTRFGGRLGTWLKPHHLINLRRSYGVERGEFAVLLVTRRGKVLSRWDRPIDEAEALAAIDASLEV